MNSISARTQKTTTRKPLSTRSASKKYTTANLKRSAHAGHEASTCPKMTGSETAQMNAEVGSRSRAFGSSVAGQNMPLCRT